MPPSQADMPATECPPPRTASGTPASRAAATAAATSAVEVAWTIAAGRRSIIALNRVRASS